MATATLSTMPPPAPPRTTSLTKKRDYILGQTLGEGEFGKVKLGWRRKGTGPSEGVQVAIKLIRKESVDTKSRLHKVEREIRVLKRVHHPNIVKLFDVIETERYIGIILEYASGGELFDYILSHRYLKDPTACRLFAQLVSGVSYLHAKGIVHRDLKLENLLLDRNRNIIITDFGFANSFAQEGAEPLDDGDNSRLDLMATSCGSPCYAAPELVVSEGLYTGRKVDYAMLAGYLPFDDDPANPEGDNINLLYKYICNTPLTFPEYVSPMARDLLRKVLVPDPRKRATLRDVMRHRWLTPHAELFETSIETFERQAKASSPLEKVKASSGGMGRSSSAREIPHNIHNDSTHLSVPGNRSSMLVPTTPTHASPSRKRHTVQVEYNQPQPELQFSRRSSAKGMEEVKTLGVSPAPALARSITATGIAGSHSPKLLSPLDEEKALNPGATLSESKSSRPNTSRLPIPQGKPRPTSYQVPATSYSGIDMSHIPNGHKEPEPSLSRSASQRSARPGSQYGRADNYIAPTFSEPKSTPTNAGGELSPPNDTLARPKKDQKKRSSIAGAEKFFNKLWANNSPTLEDKAQRRFSLFASTTKNQSIPRSPTSKSNSPNIKSKGIKPNKKFSGQNPVDKSDKASSSAAKRVMDFFKNRRIFKDSAANNHHV